MVKTVSFVLAALTAIGCANPGAAQVTTYDSRTTFTSAVKPTTVEDFTDTSYLDIRSGVLNSSTLESGLTAGAIASGVTYSATVPLDGEYSFNIDEGVGFTGGFLDGFFPDASDSILNVTFDSAQTGFGFETNNLMSSFDVLIFSGSSQIYSGSFTAADSSLAFFGFESASANITSAQIIDTANDGIRFAIDNFTFGASENVAAVPEPAEWSMLILGFGFAGGMMRRKGRSLVALQA